MIKLVSPVACVWEITNKCNYKCPHCRAFENNPVENEEIEDIIIAQFIKHHVLSVNISGGEPLLNPRLDKIVSKLTGSGIDVGISTNGSLYCDEAVKLKGVGVSFVQTSLDGPEVIHDKFRGVVGAYEKAISTMKKAKELGHFVQMNTTITAFNMDYVFENIKLAEELGIDRIFFRRVVSAGLAERNNNVLPEKERYIALLKELLEYKYRANSIVNISIDDPIIAILDKERYDESSICCSAGITSVGVDSKGNVFPCIFVRELIGNLTEQELGDIWNSSLVLKRIRERNIKVCGTCQYKWSCGGCRGANGIREWDYMCPLY